MKRIISVIAIAALLAGCNESSKIGASPKDDDLPSTRSDPKQTLIQGHATDGLIRNGNVRIYTFDEGVKGTIVGTGVTDQYGLFDAVITSDEPHYVLACVESGNYVEEASGAIISVENENKLCAATYFDPNKTFTVVVNPFSHYAYGLAEFYITQGKAVSSAITEANTAISGIFGFDILQTVPRDVSSQDSYGMAYDDRMKLGYATAAISQWALDAAIAAGLKKHTSNYSSLAFHQTIYNDLKTDGLQNGKGYAPNGLTIVNLGMGGRPITSLTTRKEFGKAMLAFSQSERNRAGVTSEELLTEADRITNSTHPIYGTFEPESLDEDGPTIDIGGLADDQYVSGVFVFSAVLGDFSGIKNATITDTLGHKFDFTGLKEISAQINTGNFTGPFTVTVTTTDLLNNRSTKTISLRAINQSPLVNMTSPSLVNSTNYNFAATAENYPQGIKSVTVNNRTASITNDGAINVNLSLAQGRNTLTLKIIDALDKTFEYEFKADVDTLLPTAVVSLPSLTDTYSVYYKSSEAAEPYLARFALSNSTDPLYIDQFHTKLGPVSADIETLRSLKWPFISFIPKDPVSDSNTSNTPANEISVSYSYKQDSDVIAERKLTPYDPSTSTYIIPFSDEFLSDKWSAFTGKHELLLKLEDKAGNINTKSFTWVTHSSNPSLDIDIGAGDWFGGNKTITFDSNDFNGLDSVVFVVDGITYVSSVVTNPSFEIDMSNLAQGLHSGVIRAYKNGILVFEKQVEFSVDNTAALVTITSPEYSKNPTYVVQGKAVDAESGVSSVKVNGVQALYDGFSGDYSRSLNVVEGYNTLTATALNNAGKSSSANKTVKGDFKAPHIGLVMPNGVYSVYYHNVLASAPTLAPLDFENNNSRLFFPEENTHLGTPHNKMQLESKKIPYLNFTVYDPASDGAETPITQIKALMTYTQGNKVLVSNLELIGSAGEFVLPLTDEFLGPNFYLVDPDALNQIHIDIVDNAGNTTSANYYFKVSYKPLNVEIVESKNLNFMAGKNTSAISSIDGKYIDEVQYTVKNNSKSPVSILLKNTTGKIDYSHGYLAGRVEQKYRYLTDWEYPVRRMKADSEIITVDLGARKFYFAECETISRKVTPASLQYGYDRDKYFSIKYTAIAPYNTRNEKTVDRIQIYSGYNTGFIPAPNRTPVVTSDNYPLATDIAYNSYLISVGMENYNEYTALYYDSFQLAQPEPAGRHVWNGLGDTEYGEGPYRPELRSRTNILCMDGAVWKKDGIIKQLPPLQHDGIKSIYATVSYGDNGLTETSARQLFKTSFSVSDAAIACNIFNLKICSTYVPLDSFTPSTYIKNIDSRIGYVTGGNYLETTGKYITSNRVVTVADDPGYPKTFTTLFNKDVSTESDVRLTMDGSSYSVDDAITLGAGETKTIFLKSRYPTHEKMGYDCNFSNTEKLCDDSYSWKNEYSVSLVTLPNLSDFSKYRNALVEPDIIRATISHSITR